MLICVSWVLVGTGAGRGSNKKAARRRLNLSEENYPSLGGKNQVEPVWYHKVRQTRIPHLLFSDLVVTCTFMPILAVMYLTCLLALMVFTQGMNTDDPMENLSHSTSIASPSGSRSIIIVPVVMEHNDLGAYRCDIHAPSQCEFIYNLTVHIFNYCIECCFIPSLV